ncbi:MAG: single-stranded DNA-binding protein [Coxiellaceae bacterium]|nr:single-stranded DNA-binding protein [Coxiellaceae bacterium]
MKFYRGTGCHVILVGLVTEVPVLSMDNQGNYIATVAISAQSDCKNRFKEYGVIVFGASALDLRRYAFPGLCLWIEGELHISSAQEPDVVYKNIHVIAEKIKFLSNFTEPNGAVMCDAYV